MEGGLEFWVSIWGANVSSWRNRLNVMHGRRSFVHRSVNLRSGDLPFQSNAWD